MRYVCPTCWSDFEEILKTESGMMRCPDCHDLVTPEPVGKARKKRKQRARGYWSNRSRISQGVRNLAAQSPSGLSIGALLFLVLLPLLGSFGRTIAIVIACLVLFGALILVFSRPGKRIRFARLQPVEGKSKSQIVRILGEPNGYTDLGSERYLLEWVSLDSHIVLVFRGENCERIEHLFFA